MRVGGAVEQRGFEERDAVEAPGGVGEFVDEQGLGGSGGAVLVEKLLDMALVGSGVFRGQDGGLRGEAMGQGVSGRALFARIGAGAGGMLGIGAIGGGATGGMPVSGSGCGR